MHFVEWSNVLLFMMTVVMFFFFQVEKKNNESSLMQLKEQVQFLLCWLEISCIHVG